MDDHTVAPRLVNPKDDGTVAPTRVVADDEGHSQTITNEGHNSAQIKLLRLPVVMIQKLNSSQINILRAERALTGVVNPTQTLSQPHMDHIPVIHPSSDDDMFASDGEEPTSAVAGVLKDNLANVFGHNTMAGGISNELESDDAGVGNSFTEQQQRQSEENEHEEEINEDGLEEVDAPSSQVNDAGDRGVDVVDEGLDGGTDELEGIITQDVDGPGNVGQDEEMVEDSDNEDSQDSDKFRRVRNPVRSGLHLSTFRVLAFWLTIQY